MQDAYIERMLQYTALYPAPRRTRIAPLTGFNPLMSHPGL